MNKQWTQVTPSDFSWEQEALEFLRESLPDHEPYRAWSNFEFIAEDGSMNEVDALILAPKGLFLVEIKSHPGEISGDAGRWVWSHEGRRKSMDNPRLLAERKAKKLASLLRSQRAARNKHGVPFIGVLVFLSARSVKNKLTGPARQQVCTRENVLEHLTEIDASWNHKRLDRPIAKTVSRAMEEAGIRESQKTRRVGPYQLDRVMDEADHFQDWLAVHADAGTERRIRVYLTRGKEPEEAERLRTAARREFRILEGIEHAGILRALDLQEHEQGPALVFDHDTNAQRLDLYLSDLGDENRLDVSAALELLRQIAEAVRFAHGHKLYHRALSPQSIWVKRDASGEFRIKIANWATADRSFETESQHLTRISHLSQIVREESGPYVALEAHSDEDADAVYLDVFSLGTIAYLLFTGQPPAQNDLELQDKLSRGKGLQVTDALNGAGQDLQDLIQYATHPNIASRLGSVEEFLEYLNEVEDELTRPEDQRQDNPTEAKPGGKSE
ncbi:MAG: NERD domain-containing protein [Roseibium sp.]|nr:NERD domain-containing protein [Roseibium sp.]